MKPAADLSYDAIEVGAVYTFDRVLSREDVTAFARLTGDHNPLHVDEAYAQETAFGANVVHGMLAAGLFSTLVGMHCPGRKALYLSQTSNFRRPILAGDMVRVRGTVTEKNPSIRMIVLKTEILKGDTVAIDGEAKVRMLP